MLDEAGKYLLAHYPGAFLLIIVATVASFISWKVSWLCAKFERIENKFEKIEDRFTSIDHQIAEINTRLSSIELQLSRISNAFERLIVFLNTKFSDFPVSMLAAKSPLQLTELGETVLIKFGGKEYVDNNIVRLLDMMKKTHFSSPLDVQNQAQLTIFWQVDTEEFTAVKNFLYNNPQLVIDDTDTELTLPLAVHLTAIYLRNKYLEVYPVLAIT